MDLTAIAAIMNVAGLGVVAYLLLTRMEQRLSALERAVNRLVVTQALLLVNDDRTKEPVRIAAQQLVEEVRAGNAQR